MDIYRTIDDVSEALLTAKEQGRKCSLLIGAGCSAKAEIPLASEIVEHIRNTRPNAYARAAKKTYAECMSKLLLTDRHALIGGFIHKAKVNWAHIGIALLMKSGFVDRVLTTNFDLLVVKACAMIGQFPAAYDFASSHLFDPEYISENAVFYLHGQYTGFVLINTKEEFD